MRYTSDTCLYLVIHIMRHVRLLAHILLSLWKYVNVPTFLSKAIEYLAKQSNLRSSILFNYTESVLIKNNRRKDKTKFKKKRVESKWYVSEVKQQGRLPGFSTMNVRYLGLQRPKIAETRFGKWDINWKL